MKTERKYRRTQNHWIRDLEQGKYQTPYICWRQSIFTEDKNDEERQKVQEDTKSLDK